MKFSYSVEPNCSSRGKSTEWQELLLLEKKSGGKRMSMMD